ncbi:hypothetical protein ACEQ8H_000808 [Pleosporales sp. CAS-2024a]
MPTLKDLKCTIELSEGQRALQEFGTTYHDGSVETYVPVPSKPQSFSIHLTSEKFIAPGIAMYVFVDGVYQCNRNRQDLKLRKGSDSRSVVDFRVRQKEEKQSDGSMIAREWKFERLDTSLADDAPDVCSPHILSNMGCIEVLVLRCAGHRNAKTVPAMNLDGGHDNAAQGYSVDGTQHMTRGSRSVYDDPTPFFSREGSSDWTPPPFTSYRSPYAETVRSQNTIRNSPPAPFSAHEPSPFTVSRRHRLHSFYSEPLSPGAKPLPSVPSEAFQYGNGPIPSGPMMESEQRLYRSRPASTTAVNTPGVNPAWLDEILTKAVKRGVEESRRSEQESGTQKLHVADVENNKGKPPGAWPPSPHVAAAQEAPSSHIPLEQQYNSESDNDTGWGAQEESWSDKQPGDREECHVNWVEDRPKWTSEEQDGGWGASGETTSDTWDTDETWKSKRAESRRTSHWSSSSREDAIRGSPDTRAVPLEATRRRQSHSSTRGHASRKSHSKSRRRSPRWSERRKSNSENHDGRVYTEASSDSSTSREASYETEKYPPSRSHSHKSRNQSHSERTSHGRKSAQYGRGRKASYKPSNGGGRSESSMRSRSNATFVDPGPTGTPLQQEEAYPTQLLRMVDNTTQLAPNHVPPPPAFVHHQGGFSRSEKTTWAPVTSWGETNKALKDTSRRQSKIQGAADAWREEDNGIHSGWDTSSAAGWESIHVGAQPKTKDDWSAEPAEKHGRNTSSAAGWESIHVGAQPKTKSDWSTSPADNNGWKIPETGWDSCATPTDAGKNPKNDANYQWTRAFRSHIPTKTPTSPPAPVNPKQIHQANTCPPPPPPTSPTPSSPNPPPPSKRHTTKSLSHYRHPLLPQPHWKFPSPPPKNPSASQAHPIQLSPPAPYGHAINRPAYLDSLAKPYAVFRFQYRSRGVLRERFGGVRASMSTSEDEDGHGRGKDREKRGKKKGMKREMESRGRGRRDWTADWVERHT